MRHMSLFQKRRLLSPGTSTEGNHRMKLLACCDASVVEGAGGIGVVIYLEQMQEDNILAEISLPMGSQSDNNHLEKCAVTRAWEMAQRICPSSGRVVIITDY